MKNPLNDPRYSVNKEWTGKEKQQYVARFEGDFIASSTSKSKAWLECIFHDSKRLNKPII